MQKNKNSHSLQMTYFSNTTSIAQGKLIILFKNKVHTVSFGVGMITHKSKMYVIISLTLIIKITAQIQLLCGINSLHTANFFPSHEGILIKALKYLFHNCNEFFKPSKNPRLTCTMAVIVYFYLNWHASTGIHYDFFFSQITLAVSHSEIRSTKQ